MRISAGELELRYKLKHLLYDFFDSMHAMMRSNLHEKGDSWRRCKVRYLKKKLKEHVKAENWVDVANFAFMLHDRQQRKRREGTSE